MLRRILSFLMIMPIILIAVSCKNNGYEIVKSSYRSKDIIIKYPHLKGFRDSKRQEENNELIKIEALKVLDFYRNDLDKLSLEVNYKFKLNRPNLSSIQYIGYGYVKDAAHPNNIFYTTNIDIINADKLKLKDIVRIDNHFIDELRDSKYIPFNPDLDLESEAKDVLNQYSDEELTQYLAQADDFGEANVLNAFSYLTADSLGISFSAPHAMGDHIEFEIKYRDIKENITKNIFEELVK